MTIANTTGALLQGKVILVIGGAGLIGKPVTQAILSEGATAIIADFNKDNAEKACNEIRQAGSAMDGVDNVLMDITNQQSIQNAIQKVAAKYGKIDGMVNCAYPKTKGYGKKFYEVDYKVLCDNLNLHIGGFFLVAQQLGEFFEKQGYGNMILLSSIYGSMAPRFEVYEGTEMTMPVEYALIKAALTNLTKYMAKFFKGKNIRVNTVSPGGIFDHQPSSFLQKYNAFCLSKGMLGPEDITGTILYLLSDLSAFVNGQNIFVDDGYSL